MPDIEDSPARAQPALAEPPLAQNDARSRWLIPLVVLILTAAVFLPALNYGFVCDDSQQIVLNQGRFTWSSIPGDFTTDVWSYIVLFKTNYYRPMFLVWLTLNYQLFGLNTTLWHASAILAHLAATFLLYLLALRLSASRLVAGTAALLFGVHPVHVEAVAWISGSTETLFATLSLGTILCHLSWRDPLSQKRPLWRAAEILLFALAMFSKETAIVIPVLVGGWDLILPVSLSPAANQSVQSFKKRAAGALVSVLPYLYVVAIYLFARYHALRSFAPLTRNWSLRMLLGTWPSTIWFYLRQLLMPFQYSLFYPIFPITSLSASRFLLPSVAVLAAACVLMLIARRSRAGGACVLLLVLPILPVLNLRAFAFEDFLHDRYAYLPSAGLCILVAMGLHHFIRRVPLRVAVIDAVAAGLGIVTVLSSRVWEDNLQLYSHAIEIAPASSLAQEFLGEELVNEERWSDALPLLNRVLLQDPTEYDTYLRIAKCHLGLGDTEQAISYFKDAIGLFPYQPDAYLDVAVIEFNQNMLPDAEAHMRQALALRPRYSPLFNQYHFRLARILEREEKWTAALAEYQAELQESPGEDDAATGLERVRSHVAAQPVQ
jgi:hypothetical protein